MGIMDWLFIYLMGSIIAFGLSCSISWSKYYKKPNMSRAKFIFLGSIISWLAVLAFLYGVLKGIFSMSENE